MKGRLVTTKGIATKSGIRCMVLRAERLSFNTRRLDLACGHSIIRRTICKSRQASARCPNCSKLAAAKPDSAGPLKLPPTDPRMVPEDIRFLIDTSVADCRLAVLSATRAQLIDAHRWCERNPDGQKSRKDLIAQALRKREVTAETEREMASAVPHSSLPTPHSKGGRR